MCIFLVIAWALIQGFGGQILPQLVLDKRIMYRLHSSTILPIQAHCDQIKSPRKEITKWKNGSLSKSGTYFACGMTGRWPSGTCLQGWGKEKGPGMTEARWRGWGVWLGESALLKEELGGWQQGFSDRDRRIKSECQAEKPGILYQDGVAICPLFCRLHTKMQLHGADMQRELGNTWQVGRKC